MLLNRAVYIVALFCITVGYISCKEDKPASARTETATTKKEEKAVSEKPVEKAKPVKTEKPKEKPKETVAERETETAKGGTSQQKLLALVNNARAKGCRCGGKYYRPAKPVVWNNQLEKAAKSHSNFMKKRNVLSHGGRGGSDAGRRITAAGYNWSTYGENIAEGYPDENSVMKGWLKSKGHCKNIMNPQFKEMGVARSGSFWTQVFAAKR